MLRNTIIVVCLQLFGGVIPGGRGEGGQPRKSMEPTITSEPEGGARGSNCRGNQQNAREGSGEETISECKDFKGVRKVARVICVGELGDKGKTIRHSHF